MLKELRHSLPVLKSLAQNFQVVTFPCNVEKLHNTFGILLACSYLVLTRRFLNQSNGRAEKRKIMIINGITCTYLRFPYPMLFPLSQKNHYKELQLPFVKLSFNKELPNT